MTHFLNSICASIIVYASVTRGGLGFARVLQFAVNRTRG
jgi:hypothetical protein